MRYLQCTNILMCNDIQDIRTTSMCIVVVNKTAYAYTSFTIKATGMHVFIGH